MTFNVIPMNDEITTTHIILARLDSIKTYLISMSSDKLTKHQDVMLKRAWNEVDNIENDIKRGYIEIKENL